MKEHIHHTHCYIPASIAAILDEKPQLVAPAVRAFYYRDPVDLKVFAVTPRYYIIQSFTDFHLLQDCHMFHLDDVEVINQLVIMFLVKTKLFIVLSVNSG